VQALTSADLYWVVALVALAFIPLIAWMPTRIHPPRRGLNLRRNPS
jgi:DHA2 family multidrug resistance protein